MDSYYLRFCGHLIHSMCPLKFFFNLLDSLKQAMQYLRGAVHPHPSRLDLSLSRALNVQNASSGRET